MCRSANVRRPVFHSALIQALGCGDVETLRFVARLAVGGPIQPSHFHRFGLKGFAGAVKPKPEPASG